MTRHLTGTAVWDSPNPGPIVNDQPWMSRRGCADVDPELFYPVGTRPEAQEEKAIAVCRTCPVRGECLEFALTDEAGLWGVWGGMAERERNKLRGKTAATS